MNADPNMLKDLCTEPLATVTKHVDEQAHLLEARVCELRFLLFGNSLESVAVAKAVVESVSVHDDITCALYTLQRANQVVSDLLGQIAGVAVPPEDK